MKLTLGIALSLIICTCQFSHAQDTQPVVSFERADFTEDDSVQLMKAYGDNKEFVPTFTLQTLIALSYFPELNNTRIRFIYKPAHSPFTTRPVFPNLLRKGIKEFLQLLSARAPCGNYSLCLFSTWISMHKSV